MLVSTYYTSGGQQHHSHKTTIDYSKLIRPHKIINDGGKYMEWPSAITITGQLLIVAMIVFTSSVKQDQLVKKFGSHGEQDSGLLVARVNNSGVAII